MSQVTSRRPFGAEGPKAMKEDGPAPRYPSQSSVRPDRAPSVRGPALARSASAAACHLITRSVGRPSLRHRDRVQRTSAALTPSLGQNCARRCRTEAGRCSRRRFAPYRGCHGHSEPLSRRYDVAVKPKRVREAHRSRRGHWRLGVALSPRAGAKVRPPYAAASTFPHRIFQRDKAPLQDTERATYPA
ncbi:hypothetical protein D3C73_683020 [compost metagenome]